ncbi:molybdopterin-binding/glycosyltransferase family 2 protein [soil metagenome]
MRFGEIAVADAEGAILAHTAKHAAGVFKKGRLLSPADIAILRDSGVATVFAARLDPEDMPEDEAAAAIARAVAGAGTIVQAPFTGRANLHAAAHGIALVDDDRVRALNRVHESLTLATAAPFDVVSARQMVATVKIIPFAAPRAAVAKALALIGEGGLVRVAAFKGLKAGLVITKLAQTKASIVAKSEEAIRARLAALDGKLGEVLVVPHEIGPVTDAITRLHAAGHNPILVFGASAIVDRGDVIPAALVGAGGDVVHLGMPVDPGNLLMSGKISGTAVIGVPSCARSPKENGFDWVLQRVMAGLPVSAHDIMDMGAGGLLKEIPTRPAPREAYAPRIAAIILAAGRSSRMGSNKLLADLDGKPLVRHVAEAALTSQASPVIVVTGHEAEKVRNALTGLDVTFAHNPSHAEGQSTSLIVGIGAVPPSSDGAIICLGDMPLIRSADLDRLIAAFSPADNRSIIVPVHDGMRGNPVLWGKEYFAEMSGVTGDRGARGLLENHADSITEVAASDAILADTDTPEALEKLRATSRS